MSQYLADIKTIWTYLKDTGDVYFISIWPTYTGDTVMPPEIANPIINAWNIGLRQLCITNNIPYINATDALEGFINTAPKIAQYIGTAPHPNDQGRPIYADAVQGITLGTGSKTPYNTILFNHSFTSADNATTVPVADSGQSFTVVSGVWGIKTNQLMKYSGGGGTFDLISFDAAKSDCKVQAKFNGNVGEPRLAFRASDQHNMFQIYATATTYRLNKVVADVSTQLMDDSTIIPAAGDIIEVALWGQAIMIWINGVYIKTISDAFNQTITKHGLSGTNGSACRYVDDFKIYVA